MTATGSYGASFTNTDGVWSLFSGGQTLPFNQNTGGLVIAGAAAIPEPATYVAGAGLATLGLAAWRRRGKRAML